jgi:hypothetical protein
LIKKTSKEQERKIKSLQNCPTCSTEFDGDLLTGGVAGKLARALLHVLGGAGGLEEGAAGGCGFAHLAAGHLVQL